MGTAEAAPTAAPAAAPTLVPLSPPAEGTFTYWGGLICSLQFALWRDKP